MRAVNLIPASSGGGGGVARVGGSSGGGALIVVALIVGLAAMLLLYGVDHHQVSSSRAKLAQTNAEVSAIRAQAVALAPYKAFIATADQRVQEVSQLIASRFDWSHAFHELGRVLPRSAALASLQGTIGGALPGASAPAAAPSATGGTAAAASGASSSATPPGSTPMFSLSGCATSEAQVAQALNRLRLMDGAAEVTLQSVTKTAASKGASPGGSGSSSAASSGGACPSGAPTFSAQVAFDALPTPPATPVQGSAATPAAATSAASSTEQISTAQQGAGG